MAVLLNRFFCREARAWGTVRRLSAAIPTWRYRRWVARHDTLAEHDRAAIRHHLARLPRRPTISILIAGTGAAEMEGLPRSLRSLTTQLYGDWEACVAADQTLVDAGDPRIRTVRVPPACGEAEALNAALAIARGEFVAFVEAGDRLAEHALYEVAAELDRAPMSDIVYCDEDFCDKRGLRRWPYFKPDWDPDLALGQDLLGRLCVMRLNRVREHGGLRREFDPAAQFDLRLRLGQSASAERIRHVPAVLYHRHAGASAPRDFCSTEYTEAAREAVWRHCRAQDPVVIAVEPAPDLPFWNRIVRAVPDPEPLVSVIVPTRDRANLLRECARGVLTRTDYRTLEFIVMDNDSVEPATSALFDELRDDPRVRIIKSPGPFNFSAIINQGAAAARGDILLLLNNDIEVQGGGWLREMVAQVLRPAIGAVGARLLFPNGRIQHAGVTLTPEPNAYHALRLARGDDPGYFGQLALTRTYLAVTGACLAIRRQVFFEMGGLDERHLAVTFNDIDLCLRIGARGYRVICTPRAELVHRESVTRGSDGHGAKKRRARAELDYAVSRSSSHFERDRYANPNLTYTYDKGVKLSAPRMRRSWRAAGE